MRFASVVLGTLIALVLAVPGAAYLLNPILPRKKGSSDEKSPGTDEFQTLAVTLNELAVGVPREFPIVVKRQDAWVTYPPEPVGTVWLVRQEEGTEPPVLAFTSECPHLGCAIALAADGHGFFCPCHTSAFALDGERLNHVPPRGMDPLDVQIPADHSQPIRVKYQRFRTMSEERTPLA
ncbi:MAG TPA: Rieske 2Fe-2S domain-containing protein [Isosphaeraceae bacterium]|nr:Rieske 2Fe-2S domain-containing protein [Isosphaeraceae bacterium]